MSGPDRFLAWRKARASATTGNCVEVAATADGVVVRNSKRPDGPVIYYTESEWTAFLTGVKEGEFDDLLRSVQD